MTGSCNVPWRLDEIKCHIKREITPHRFSFKHISREGINLQIFLANLGHDSQSDEVYRVTQLQ